MKIYHLSQASRYCLINATATDVVAIEACDPFATWPDAVAVIYLVVLLHGLVESITQPVSLPLISIL